MDKISPVLSNMLGCHPFESQELQDPVHLVNQQPPDPFSPQTLSFSPVQGLNSFSFRTNPTQQLNQEPIRLLGGEHYEGLKHFPGTSQWTSGVGGLIDDNQEMQWQRIRWTDDMVRVLINAVSYVVKALSDCERGELLMPVKGKWKAVSMAMAERGYSASPQQCEDKFNDINRKYKRLTDILGCVTCDVVQDPMLLGSVHLSAQLKEEVWRLLSCRQLFYQEMCSYHNWNRKHLPHDESLEQAVISALTGQGKPDFENTHLESPVKRQKLQEDEGVPDKNTHAANPEDVVGQHENMDGLMVSRVVQLRAKKLQIQKQTVELEKKRIEWLKSCQKQDRKLHTMKLENELMKLENELLLNNIKNREISHGRN